MKIFTVAMLAALTVAVPASATINLRPLNHARLIDAGVRSGKLTRTEARILRNEQTRIAYKRRLFENDGNFTKAEKKIISDHRDAAKRHIDRLKNNAERRA